MGSITIFVGRFLLVFAFICCGITKLQDPASSHQHLTTKFKTIQEHLQKQHGFQLPIPETFVNQQGKLIVQATAVLEILAAALVIFNVKLGACLLCTYLLVITPFNCPCLYTNQEEQTKHIIVMLKNIGIFGGLLIFLSLSPSPAKGTMSTKKKRD